ncbi:hypothetical protein FKW77_004734 [Venturia effusa]|uniref:Uncharacterized protein n=1 Tax=Venturia effusa TaxID=50376 RepID=A0A517LNU3_9PEZI|nr:hypothetical protein FKW77_004734 [Venturia effusa]
MVCTKGKHKAPMDHEQANKNYLQDSYRPADRGSQESQDENRRPDHEYLPSHARGDSYRPEYRSDSLRTADSHRPRHSSYHSYRKEESFYNTRHQADTYRPRKELQNQGLADTYRPRYELATQDRSFPLPESSTEFTSQAESDTFSFGGPAPPPPSPIVAAMDIEMEELVVSTSQLTVANEESSKSVVALTRELLLRGLPLEVASIYASEEVLFIPVHKVSRRFDEGINHSLHCKNCGRLQPIGPKRMNDWSSKSHNCGAKSVKQFAAVKQVGGWGRVLRDLEDRKWRLDPELPPSHRNKSKIMQDVTVHAAAKDDAPSGPKVLSRDRTKDVLKGRKGKKRAKKVKTRTPAHEARIADCLAVRDLVKMQRGELGENPSQGERRQARVRAWEIVRGHSGKPDADKLVSQQELPAFDLRDLGKQLDSLSSPATEDKRPT